MGWSEDLDYYLEEQLRLYLMRREIEVKTKIGMPLTELETSINLNQLIYDCEAMIKWLKAKKV